MRGIAPRINAGEHGRVAIQILDEVRRPFLDINALEVAASNNGYSSDIQARLEHSIKHGIDLIDMFKAAAVYNPEVLRHVERLETSFVAWIQDERAMFAIMGEGNSVSVEKLHEADLISAVGFSRTMSMLGGAEKPLHEDIEQGSLAVMELVSVGGGMLAVLLGAAFYLSWFRNKTLVETLAQVKEHESNFEAIFNAIPDAIVVTKRNSSIVAVNHGMERTFGYTIDDLSGKNTSILYENEEEYERQGRIHYDLSVEEKNEPYEVSYRAKDGFLFVGETVGTAINGANGETLGFIGIIRDITERKHIENQLHRSQRMEAIGQLTGGIAHDFNNLLSVMFGNAELLKGKVGDDEKSLRRLESIIKAVDLGASLTNRLLAFSRQQALSPRPTAVNGLVLGLEDMLQRTLGETVKLHTNFGSGPCEALIDSAQFENALINLAVNARDAMGKGGVLTIETADVTLDEAYSRQHEDVTPGDYVMVAVSDTGGGMKPAVLEKAFEPFFTTKGVGRGSGLGLSMVYGFIMQSKGHVTIYSEVGHGTTIKLYMPRSQEPVGQDDTMDGALEFEQGSERILVVEDNDDVREIPVGILRNQGYQVVEAENGEEAIKNLQDGPPFDLLFTDMILPGGMSGVKVAEYAKRIQPDIKVIFTTGYADNALANNGKAGSGVTVVNKPYRRKELLGKVRAVLNDVTDS
jgi:PAS domain S-box-containing protein